VKCFVCSVLVKCFVCSVLVKCFVSSVLVKCFVCSDLLKYFVRLSSEVRSRKPRLLPQGIRRTDHATPLYQQELALTSPTSGSRSVGIVRSGTKATKLVRLKIAGV
jgi:hypothetical protein